MNGLGKKKHLWPLSQTGIIGYVWWHTMLQLEFLIPSTDITHEPLPVSNQGTNSMCLFVWHCTVYIPSVALYSTCRVKGFAVVQLQYCKGTTHFWLCTPNSCCGCATPTPHMQLWLCATLITFTDPSPCHKPRCTCLAYLLHSPFSHLPGIYSCHP